MPYELSRQCPANHYPYTIRAGDTLYGISNRFRVYISDILAANPGINPNNLRIGQTLCIPFCPPNHILRVIQPGDTLYKIAQEYNTTVQTLISANPQITNPDLLTVGDMICVPVTDPIAQQIRNMTLEEKIGQMLIVGFDGYAVNEQIWTMIRNFHVGGVILYGYNVQSAGQLLALINALKRTNETNRIPLFISVDEEGGRVSRMPSEIRDIPSNQVIGRRNSAQVSYRIGNVIAREIKAFGFNMNFAPVLDINSNPANPVIGDRAFGNNVEIVSRLGVQAMRGMQDAGIIPVIKHFPGHGDTSVDSHVGLPALSHNLSRLYAFELIPFQEAIRNGADAVMIAHILLYRIDAQYPSSLSRTIITDILRSQINFNGVVISDDMTMGAIIRNYEIGASAVRAVNAGSDIVLVSRGYNNQIRVINALINAVRSGTIPIQTINNSVYRILRLKQKYNIRDNIITSVDINAINTEIDAVLQQLS